MSPLEVLSDAQWERIEPLLPSNRGWRGHPFRDHRGIVEGIIFRFRTGIAWRDLPAHFGPWKTVWKRHRRFSTDGTWDQILTALLAQADDEGELDWDGRDRLHHQPRAPARHHTPARHGGTVELHEFAAGAA